MSVMMISNQCGPQIAIKPLGMIRFREVRGGSDMLNPETKTEIFAITGSELFAIVRDDIHWGGPVQAKMECNAAIARSAVASLNGKIQENLEKPTTTIVA